MNRKRNPRSLFGPAMFVCAVAFMLFTIPMLAQQSLPTRHVRAVVSSRRAAAVGSLPSTQQLKLAIMLSPRNQDALTDLVHQLYNPSSSSYRRFLTVARFTDQFSPTTEDYEKVVRFAQANGFTVTDTP